MLEQAHFQRFASQRFKQSIIKEIAKKTRKEKLF